MSTSTCSDVLIVGAGHAGAQAAIALRQRRFAGTIGLLWDEDGLPYERPPLSKDFLSGARTAERLRLRPHEFWIQQRIDLLPGRRVSAIDARERRAMLSEGSVVEWSSLVWAAGGRARPLRCEGADLGGVHLLRSLADARALRADVATADRIAVVGGGFVGLEVAATLRKQGRSVTVLEQAPQLLARVAGEVVGRFFAEEHARHGVEVRTGARVVRLEGEGGRATGVRLDDGAVVPADVVLVGIGLVPCCEIVREAGAAGTDGIDVDQGCRTTIPDVYAIGDCAAQVNPFAGGSRVRIESVANASAHATAVACSIRGEAPPPPPVPWFWSEQYDLRLQTVGLAAGHDEVMVRGDPARRSFSAVYLRDGRVVALDCINRSADFSQARALIASGGDVSRRQLADPEASLGPPR